MCPCCARRPQVAGNGGRQAVRDELPLVRGPVHPTDTDDAYWPHGSGGMAQAGSGSVEGCRAPGGRAPQAGQDGRAAAGAYRPRKAWEVTL